MGSPPSTLPKPPTPARTSVPPLPPQRNSGTMGIAPARPAVPSSPPPSMPPLPAAPYHAQPHHGLAPQTLPMQAAPPFPGAHAATATLAGMPALASVPPPHPLPPAPPMPALATAPPPAPIADAKKPDEPRQAPIVDPKLALLLPLGAFGAFAVLTLVVVFYALVIRPRTGAAAATHGADPSAAVTRP